MKEQTSIITRIIIFGAIILGFITYGVTANAATYTVSNKYPSDANTLTNSLPTIKDSVNAVRSMDLSGGSLGLNYTHNTDLTVKDASSKDTYLDVHQAREADIEALSILSQSGYGGFATTSYSSGNISGVQKGQNDIDVPRVTGLALYRYGSTGNYVAFKDVFTTDSSLNPWYNISTKYYAFEPRETIPEGYSLHSSNPRFGFQVATMNLKSRGVVTRYGTTVLYGTGRKVFTSNNDTEFTSLKSHSFATIRVIHNK